MQEVANLGNQNTRLAEKKACVKEKYLMLNKFAWKLKELSQRPKLDEVYEARILEHIEELKAIKNEEDEPAPDLDRIAKVTAVLEALKSEEPLSENAILVEKKKFECQTEIREAKAQNKDLGLQLKE